MTNLENISNFNGIFDYFIDKDFYKTMEEKVKLVIRFLSSSGKDNCKYWLSRIIKNKSLSAKYDVACKVIIE